MTKYYIADTHFGHKAILNLNNRPFSSIEDMNETIITNWNARVTKSDEVYILGDFMFRSEQKPDYYLDRLPGQKHLILGNHDRWSKHVDLSRYFETVNQISETNDEGHHLILCHYPMAEWPRYFHGSLHIFGHLHNRRDTAAFFYYQGESRMLNAGVDINHYTPVTLGELVINNNSFRENSTELF